MVRSACDRLGNLNYPCNILTIRDMLVRHTFGDTPAQSSSEHLMPPIEFGGSAQRRVGRVQRLAKPHPVAAAVVV